MELYETLEVEKTATQAEIKKAYKKFALKYHPDKPTGDAEKFKKISNAYQILIDPEKRRTYDLTGSTSDNHFSFSPSDIFEKFFSQENPFKKRIQPITITRLVSLEELCTRKILKFKVNRKKRCDCQDASSICHTCQGKGCVQMTRNMGIFMQMITSPCDKCKGNGKEISSCQYCKEGFRDSEKVFNVYLTPETRNGQCIKFEGEGNDSHDGNTGDFVVTIRYKPHDKFDIIKEDLVFKRKTTLKEALCGYTDTVLHPDGSTCEWKSNQVLSPYDNLIIGKGLVERSNLTVIHEIIFPKTLEQSQKDILNTVL